MRRGQIFKELPEGGKAKNFGLPPKGGRKILDSIIFGNFSFMGQSGGPNIFRRVPKGGEKVLDVSTIIKGEGRRFLGGQLFQIP